MRDLDSGTSAAFPLLRRRINALGSPIYRLPHELLLEVSSCLTSEADLINATHVSHQLRNILLACPRLWSHLDLDKEEMAHAFFERSKQALLSVSTPSHGDMCSEFEYRLFEQLERIAALNLRRHPTPHWLSHRLPSLRRLKISYDDAGGLGWGGWCLAEGWTPWSSPSLTSLALLKLVPSLDVPNLRCLELRDLDGLADKGSLITLFQSCPLLEHVSIHNSVEPQIEAHLKISLPNLHTYTQVNSDPAPLSLFNALSLPRSCSILLHVRHLDGSTATAGYTARSFKSPGYLDEIKGVRLKISVDLDSGEADGVLEIVNARGTRLCFQRTFANAAYTGSWQESNAYAPGVAHLGFFQGLRGRMAEVLCIDERTLLGGLGRMAARFLEEALGLEGVGTLILSGSAVSPCLSVLSRGLATGNRSLSFFSFHTLVIHLDRGLLWEHAPQLFDVARARVAVGLPLNSVLLLPHGSPEIGLQTLEGLEGLVGRLMVVEGGPLGWDIDAHFLGRLQES